VIALVARREIRERLRSRALLWSTLLLLGFVGATAVLGAVLDTQKTYRVAVPAPVPRGLDVALQRAATPFEAKVKLDVVASGPAGRTALEDDEADALLLLGVDRLVFRSSVDAQLAAVADGAVRALRNRLPPAPELSASTLEPAEDEPSDAATAVAILGSIAMIVSLSIYGQWVLVGVVEEKSNRVVELVLSTVRPRHLLAGKVIGIGLIGLAQLALVAGLAVALLAAGVFDAPAGLGADVLLAVPWFGLGFALYAVGFAAAGALASRQQDAATAGQPVTVTLAAAYLLGYAAVSADASGTLAQLLTVFPPTAPMVLPARSALVGVPLWQHALAIALVLVSIWALVRFAGRVYARGLLHAGPRLGARAAWRMSRER